LIWRVPGLTKPGSVCERTLDFMTLYPTLTDLCSVPTPQHVDGTSIRPLLANPAAAWAHPGITTYGQGRHAIRTEKWRYIRYEDGSEELYDEENDPYEWNNLAAKPDFTAKKRELAVFLPKENKPAIKSSAGGGEEGDDDAGAGKQARKARKQKK
jgi:arylsulfatase A-like enzyme